MWTMQFKAGVLNEEDLPWEVKWTLGRKKNWRIAALVGSVIENSSETIAMDTQTRRAFLLLQQFLFDAVHTNPVAKSEESKAEKRKKPVCIFYQPWGKTPNRIPRCLGEGRNPYGGVRLYLRNERQVCHSSLHRAVCPKSWQESANNRMRSSAQEERRNGQDVKRTIYFRIKKCAMTLRMWSVLRQC